MSSGTKPDHSPFGDHVPPTPKVVGVQERERSNTVFPLFEVERGNAAHQTTIPGGRNMTEEESMKGPFLKSQVGRFQLSLWRRKIIIPSRHDWEAEREVERVRACVQYSRYNQATGSWENQSIWCSPEELRDLANVMDKLNEDTMAKSVAHGEVKA